MHALLSLVGSETFVDGAMPLVPLIGAWAWHPTDVEADSPVPEQDILDSFNGVPTLRVIETGEVAHLAWKVDGYFVHNGLWLYVALGDEDIDALDSQHGLVQPSVLLLNTDLARYVAWARTKHERMINRGLI